MDIRQLLYFIEVAKQKSFTKAANTLHISQPALSKMVKSLEEELEIELIDRRSKHIELTDAGEIVFSQSQKVVHAFNDLHALLQDMTTLKKGKIKFGLPPLIGTVFFPKIIKGFQTLYPNVKIQLIEHGAKRVKQLVKEGELDFGIIMLPEEDNDFNIIPFATEELMLFVHTSHRLAAKEEVSILDVKDEPFILFTEDFTLHDRIIQECQNAGFQPNVSYESSQWDFISEMVEQDLGVTFFPKSITKKANPNTVKAIPIKDPIIPWNLGIILKKKNMFQMQLRRLLNI
ncbi:LysR family transcriptional regulator [Heyndrickxia ginsengihumi]|uniref:LysR family transcriptional regulator n=1 Tax=Heyndrickxia ginsengihumi TaxID=363870 RepID=A0A0A6XW85_9BACI|nr:LysR family transcriptional regulator [Heyndrickxia ginsengihumi]KHD84392.1 LysR family transcriptional regulator [Heyndrickxia ginsengihumi]